MQPARPSLCVLLFLAGMLTPCAARAAGLAYNDNFTVLAPDQSYADAVLAKADEVRTRVAKEWFGSELPAGAGKTKIWVGFSTTEDRGFFWPIDDQRRTMHSIMMKTTPERAVGAGISHEIVHLVFTIRYPDRLDTWVEEGIAAREDDAGRIEKRRAIVAQFAATGAWPRLASVLPAQTFADFDQQSYAVAASVTEFLLARGDRGKFLAFAVAGKKQGWDAAARQCYGFDGLPGLQAAWQAWATAASRSNNPGNTSASNTWRTAG